MINIQGLTTHNENVAFSQILFGGEDGFINEVEEKKKVDDFHAQIANHLIQEYSTILGLILFDSISLSDLVSAFHLSAELKKKEDTRDSEAQTFTVDLVARS